MTGGCGGRGSCGGCGGAGGVCASAASGNKAVTMIANTDFIFIILVFVRFLVLAIVIVSGRFVLEHAHEDEEG